MAPCPPLSQHPLQGLLDPYLRADTDFPAPLSSSSLAAPHPVPYPLEIKGRSAPNSALWDSVLVPRSLGEPGFPCQCLTSWGSRCPGSLPESLEVWPPNQALQLGRPRLSMSPAPAQAVPAAHSGKASAPAEGVKVRGSAGRGRLRVSDGC